MIFLRDFLSLCISWLFSVVTAALPFTVLKVAVCCSANLSQTKHEWRTPNWDKHPASLTSAVVFFFLNLSPTSPLLLWKYNSKSSSMAQKKKIENATSSDLVMNCAVVVKGNGGHYLYHRHNRSNNGVTWLCWIMQEVLWLWLCLLTVVLLWRMSHGGEGVRKIIKFVPLLL